MNPATRSPVLAALALLLFVGAAPVLPKDVVALQDRFDGCLHWSGEYGDAPERKAQIDRALRELKCNRYHRDYSRLRHKYARNSAVLKTLADIDDTAF